MEFNSGFKGLRNPLYPLSERQSVQSCCTLSHMLLLYTSFYLKSVLRYKFLILDAYHMDTVFIWARIWGSLVFFSFKPKGVREKKCLGKHWCSHPCNFNSIFNWDFFFTFMGPCIVNIFHYISKNLQRYTVYFIWKLLYIFRMLPPPIIRSANNCIYSIWYLSHRYYYLQAAVTLRSGIKASRMLFCSLCE